MCLVSVVFFLRTILKFWKFELKKKNSQNVCRVGGVGVEHVGLAAGEWWCGRLAGVV